MAQVNSSGFYLFWASDADETQAQSSAMHLPLRAMPIWQAAEPSDDVKLKEKSERRFELRNKHHVVMLQCEAPNSTAREQWLQAARDLHTQHTAARRSARAEAPAAAAASSTTEQHTGSPRSSITTPAGTAAPALVAWATDVAMHPRSHAGSTAGSLQTQGAPWSSLPTPILLSVVQAWAQLQS